MNPVVSLKAMYNKPINAIGVGMGGGRGGGF